MDVAFAACDPLLLWLVVCTSFSVTWSHVELLAEPRTLYLTWIIPLQIGAAENILGFSRNVSLFSPPARLAGAAACCLFAACSCPPTLCFPLVHLHWVNFWGRKGRGTEQGWGEDERGERFRQAAPQRCYLLTANWWMKTLAQHVKPHWAEPSQFSCCSQARASTLYLHVRTTNKESHSKWTKCSAQEKNPFVTSWLIDWYFIS